MPKKGKKGKKAAAEEAARLEAEAKAKELEEKRKFEEELKAREQALLAREEQIAKREQDAQALETDFRSKLEGLDAEVTLRARSGIAAAEAREAATERRAKMREGRARPARRVPHQVVVGVAPGLRIFPSVDPRRIRSFARAFSV